MSLLRAKSRLRRLRSVHACGRGAVGIFPCNYGPGYQGGRLPHQRAHWESNDEEVGVRTGKAMTVNQKLPDDLAGIREHSLFVKRN